MFNHRDPKTGYPLLSEADEAAARLGGYGYTCPMCNKVAPTSLNGRYVLLAEHSRSCVGSGFVVAVFRSEEEWDSIRRLGGDS